nr:MAG TPA: hypothetical protein [Caudoviricetes sp.]
MFSLPGILRAGNGKGPSYAPHDSWDRREDAGDKVRAYCAALREVPRCAAPDGRERSCS